MRIDVDLGVSARDGVPATVDLGELLATRLLVQGNSGSGKSHLLRRLLEQSAPHVQQLVIDPEGDFVGLAERYGHVLVEGDRSPADLAVIAGRVRQHRISTVLTLEMLDAEGQMRAAAAFLNALFEAERDFWFPVLVAVDEAQLFAPAVAGDVAEDVRRLSLGAMTNLMCRGRKRGLAGVIATQRLAKLAKNVAAEATNFLMGRTFLDIDMARAADLLGLERRQAEMFRELTQGHFIGLGPAISRRPLAIRVGAVETTPRAAPPRLMPRPDQSHEQAAGLALAPMPAAAPRSPIERRPSPPPMTEILARIVRERDAGVGTGPDMPPGEASADEPHSESLTPTERSAVYKQAAFEMMRDLGAAFRPEPVLYGDFQVRCRILRTGIGVVPMADFRLHLDAGRAGLDPLTTDSAEWDRALAAAQTVPDDLRGVFLILAGAALARAPCPSDAELARRLGMRSAARARSRLGHLDRLDLAILRVDPGGRRSAVLPGFGWETAPGDPNAPAAGDPRLSAAE